MGISSGVLLVFTEYFWTSEVALDSRYTCIYSWNQLQGEREEADKLDLLFNALDRSGRNDLTGIYKERFKGTLPYNNNELHLS